MGDLTPMWQMMVPYTWLYIGSFRRADAENVTVPTNQPTPLTKKTPDRLILIRWNWKYRGNQV